MDPTLQQTLKLHELRRKLDLLKRERELRKANAIAFFEPHEKQMWFYEAALYHFRYGRTGNRFGKSEMGGGEDIAFARGERPWFRRSFDILNGKREVVGRHEGRDDHPLVTLGLPDYPTQGVIVTADWDKSKEIFTEQYGARLGKIMQYCPKEWMGQPTRNHSGAIDRIPIRHKSGGWSLIRFETVKSFKQNALGLESSYWDWCHIDEPIPEDMWKAIVRGFVDRGGKAWFTCTPITEPWIDQAFVPDLESQSKEDLGIIINDAESRWMMTGEMDDNPYTTEEDRARVLSWYTEEEKETRRKGIPASYSGLVYKEFNWGVHVWKDLNPPPGWSSWEVPPPDYTIRYAIDYHPRKPHHVLFLATSPWGVTYAYAEIFDPCLMSDLAAQIKTRLGPNGSTVPGIIDPLASTPNKVTDITPMDEIIHNGLPVLPATKDPHNGILKVKELLKTRDRANLPIFYVFRSLPRFLFEISRGFIWDGDTNKPEKKNDDAMENFYRLTLQGLEYIEPEKQEAWTPILLPDLDDSILDFSTFAYDDPSVERKRSLRDRIATRCRS